MKKYDEILLDEKLNTLDSKNRVLFAAACAERLFDLYSFCNKNTGIGGPKHFKNILDTIWATFEGEKLSNQQIEDLIEALDEQDENETGYSDWEDCNAYSENFVSSVYYTLRCLLNNESQDAIWAARQIYEALDFFVHNNENIHFDSPEAENRILSNRNIQDEIERQLRDLDELLLFKRKKGNTVLFLPEFRKRSEQEGCQIRKTIFESFGSKKR